MAQTRRRISSLILAAAMLVPALPAPAADIGDEVPRIAVVSAFEPELALLKAGLENPSAESINGIEFTTGALESRDVVLFLSGISVVNAAMSAQTALDFFDIERIVFSGIAGGVDERLNVGDVVIAERWGQYLEMYYARETADGGWSKIPFFDYPYANYGMMFPRSITVQPEGAESPETRFWFPVSGEMLAVSEAIAGDIVLDRCGEGGLCLDDTPRVVTGRLRRVGKRLHRQRGLPRLHVPHLRRRGSSTWKARRSRTWPTPTAGSPSSPYAASPISPAASLTRTS